MISFVIYYFWRAIVCLPLLCLCRPFCIVCLESNLESCRSKQARYQVYHPSPSQSLFILPYHLLKRGGGGLAPGRPCQSRGEDSWTWWRRWVPSTVQAADPRLTFNAINGTAKDLIFYFSTSNVCIMREEWWNKFKGISSLEWRSTTFYLFFLCLPLVF
jgi:hypothetical protein